MGGKKDTTKVLVSGYPRSGNTFLGFVIRELYGSNSAYSDRSHTTIDVESNLDKDVCVVIRNPLQSIASWNHFRTQLGFNADKNLTLDADFNYYLRYYNFIDKHLDQVALMDFAKFSKDSTYITNKIAKKFNREPIVSLDAESLKKNMMARGGRNHLPRVPNTTRQEIENRVSEHPLYEDVVGLYNYLISKEDSNDY